jgi:hypothetical protein
MRLTQLNNIKPATLTDVFLIYFTMTFITIPLTAFVFIFITAPLYLIYKLPVNISLSIIKARKSRV